MSTSFAAVVVARTGLTAKSRLATILTSSERALLARAMVEDVLRACNEAHVFARITLVTDTEEGRSLGHALGADVEVNATPGLNSAVSTGIQSVRGLADAVLVLPGDVPLVNPADLSQLIAAADGDRAVVVATDEHRLGTNALLLRPPRIVAPSFGVKSAARHIELARRAGANATEVLLSRLALDVDTPAALKELVLRQPNGATGAALERLGLLASPSPAEAV